MPMVAERSDPHPFLGDAVMMRIAGLHKHGRAAVDHDLDRLAVAQIHQRVAGDAASFFEPPSGDARRQARAFASRIRRFGHGNGLAPARDVAVSGQGKRSVSIFT